MNIPKRPTGEPSYQQVPSRSDRRWKTFVTDPARIFERLEYNLKLVEIQLNLSIGKNLITLDAACINPTHHFQDME